MSNGVNQQKTIYTSVHSTDTTNNFVFVAQSIPKADKTNELYNISAIGHNTRNHNFLFTAGSLGNLNFWDLSAKNKITMSSVGHPINCAAVNANGTIIASGVRHDWTKGVWSLNEVNYPPRIGIRMIGDGELHYKNNSHQAGGFGKGSLM